MKPTKLIITLLCLMGMQTYAQKYDARVARFISTIFINMQTRPQEVSATIKVDIDGQGKVSSIDLSDSAPPEFMKRFNEKKALFDVPAVNEYAKTNKLKNISLLIPYYIIDKNHPKASEYGPQMKQFNHHEFTGKAIMFKPDHITFGTKRTVTSSSN